jgi:ecdysteroid 2-hydroxylase
LHLTIDDLHKKYGSIFRVKIESKDTVFVSSAEHIRSIFAFEGKYPKHPIPPAWLHYNQKYDVKRGLLFMYAQKYTYKCFTHLHKYSYFEILGMMKNGYITGK